MTIGNIYNFLKRVVWVNLGFSIKLTFVKETDRGFARWYVVLDDYPGSRADLEMVDGADEMCEYLAGGGSKANVIVKLGVWNEDGWLRLFKFQPAFGGYRYVWWDDYTSDKKFHLAWLCPVTKYVFGYFPKNIYIKPNL